MFLAFNKARGWHMRIKNRWLFIAVFPVIMLLTACNDSDDEQQIQNDPSPKPLMRCAP
ncbi:hypothetical protein D3C80_1229860 [compost metagenome]